MLVDLTEEFAALQRSLRENEDTTLSLGHILPDLVDDSYQRGLSVLSDALAMLERSEGPRRRRLEYELDDVMDRLEDPSPTASASLNETSSEKCLVRRRSPRSTAPRDGRDLLFQAETLDATLHRGEQRFARCGPGPRRCVDSVIETLEENIRRVREVQDELRKFQY